MLHIMNIITSDVVVYLLIIVGLLVLGLLIWNIKLHGRLTRLMHGKQAITLEDSFNAMRVDLQKLEVFRNDLEAYLKIVDKRLSQSIRGVEAINFNAFAGAESGGKSFAIAFLNEHGDGVIISSLHTRDRVNVFTKRISHFASEIPLSDEEEKALTNAKKSCII